MTQIVYKCVKPDTYRLKFKYPENAILYGESMRLKETSKEVNTDIYGISEERFTFVYERILRWCVRKDKQDEIICVMRDYFENKLTLTEMTEAYGLTEQGLLRLIRWTTRKTLNLLEDNTHNGVFDESKIPVYCQPEYRLKSLGLFSTLEELVYATDSSLTHRMYNVLVKAGYKTVREVYEKQEELPNTIGLSSSCYTGLSRTLERMGYPLEHKKNVKRGRKC